MVIVKMLKILAIITSLVMVGYVLFTRHEVPVISIYHGLLGLWELIEAFVHWSAN
jgi:hypothetical protein